jgi:hypothetical protein
MEPFKISNHLRNVVGTYPQAELIINAGKEGGEAARHAIARLWLSEGIPYAFKDCPSVYESVRYWVATRLSVDPKEVNITGSARLGQSLAPKKIGKVFGNGSDLDIFIISGELFEKLKHEFNDWSSDFESNKLNPSNDRERKFWESNLHRVPKNLGRGFIDTKLIPNHEKYQNTRSIAQTMFLLKEKLSVTPQAPKISEASVRCYKSWSSYVQQVSLGLQ